MCPRLSQLELSFMSELIETERLSIVNIFRQIIQSNPQIVCLNMEHFSRVEDREQNIGELVLESLLSSNIDSITDINFTEN